MPINIRAILYTVGTAIQANLTGNTRGDYAIDLQQDRTNDSEVASGDNSFIAGGRNNTASGDASHAEGGVTTASGNYSHAEGANTIASGLVSHAEGDNTIASANHSHAEGISTTASGLVSHAEGGVTTASGNYSHAEGGVTTASGNYSHAEGYEATASGTYSHAEGYQTIADGDYSHAGGRKADTNGHDGVFIWADSEDAAFTADRADQFKIRCSGGAHFVQNDSTAAIPAMTIEQKDVDQAVFEFLGVTVHTSKTAADEYIMVKDPSGNTRYLRLYS